MKLVPGFHRSWIMWAKELARATLAADPIGRDKRVSPVGELVLSVVFPAEICFGTNKIAYGSGMREQMKAKADLFDLLKIQVGQKAYSRSVKMLDGRPQVLLTRFTSRSPDRGSDWTKYPVDLLRPPRRVVTKKGIRLWKGIGLIKDDDEESIDLQYWWEKGPVNGVVLMRVYTGET